MNHKTNTGLLSGLVALLLLAGTTMTQATPLQSGPGLDLNEDAVPQPLRIPVDEYVGMLQEPTHGGIAPNHLDHDSIRPGQRILVNIPGAGTFICSLSFIFKDTSADKYYASTAGHCLLPPSVSTSHVGGNQVFNPSGTTVSVCYDSCLLGGQLSGFLWSAVPLGTVVYARQSGPADPPYCPAGQIGNDFGLIEINAAWYTTFASTVGVNPAMAVWNGPHGQIAGEGTGNVVVHYGNGITWGSTFATGARAGVTLNDGIWCSWQAAISIAGGDSGSAISYGSALHAGAGLHGDRALGTITHGIIGVGTPGFGTTVDRGIMMASNDAGIGIALVDAGTPIP